MSEVKALVDQHIEYPQFGFLGQTRINVLKLNIALDEPVRKAKDEQVLPPHIFTNLQICDFRLKLYQELSGYSILLAST